MAETLYAFPGEYVTHLIAAHDGSAEPATVQHPGMTLRDYFAAQAITASWQSAMEFSRNENPEPAAARQAYAIADAMLAERSKSPDREG